MKVAHFCTFPHGGAAGAAKRQHYGLQAAGVESKFYYFRDEQRTKLDSSFERIEFAEPRPIPPLGPIQKFITKQRRRRIYRLHNTHLANHPPASETYAMAELPDATRLDWRSIDADIVNLHWISFFADYPSFFKSIPNRIPIVWTLHDTQAFTGGCHYNGPCMRFADGCGNCPQVNLPSPQDVSLKSFVAKRNALARKRTYVVAPCDWMLNLANRSQVWPRGTQFQKIEYGLDLSKFSPISPETARSQLGIAPDKKYIAFGAMEIENPRKGFDLLTSALKIVRASGTDCECLVFGDGKIEQTPDLPKMHSLGFVDDKTKLNQIYSSADIVVVPSVEDNQPQVGLESMACGTPVVAFNAGGMPEYVIDGNTGWLAQEIDAAQLADKIFTGLQQGPQLRESASALIQSNFEIGQQTQRWIELYQSILLR